MLFTVTYVITWLFDLFELSALSYLHEVHYLRCVIDQSEMFELLA